MPCLPVFAAGAVSIHDLEIEMKRAASAGGTSPVLSLSSREATVSVLAFLVGGVIGWVYETFICASMAGKEINLMHGGMGIPFLTIYAVGAFLIASLLGPRLAGRTMRDVRSRMKNELEYRVNEKQENSIRLKE